MEEVVADALPAAAAAAGGAMADAVETGELLDVEMDEFAGTLAMVAANRLGRDDRFLSPALPSRFQRPSHLRAVRSLIPQSRQQTSATGPSSTICRIISSRPSAVVRAFSCASCSSF
jgi:hypothetical protein